MQVSELTARVSELETTLKSRNPNSLAALITASKTAGGTAAAAAAGVGVVGADDPLKLQHRVAQLEAQLKAAADDHQSALRVLRQQHDRVKLQYDTPFVKNNIEVIHFVF